MNRAVREVSALMPTCFGNIAAREFVFARIHAARSGWGDDIESIVNVPDLVLAYAGLIVASTGDYSLANECGFAIDYVKSGNSINKSTAKQIANLIACLEDIRDKSHLLQYWRRRKQSKLFTANVDHLIRQLALFPKCARSAFAKMTKRELSRIAESIGENYFDGPSNTLSLSNITPASMVEMGRFRGIQSINFMPLTNAKDANAFDMIVNLAIQNWHDSLTTLNFSKIGTLDGDTQFEFPENIADVLAHVNTHVFEATGFTATNEVVSAVLGSELEVLRFGFNRLTPAIFDKIEAKCRGLAYFFVERSFRCSDPFVRRATDFQRAHKRTKMILNGMDLKTLIDN